MSGQRSHRLVMTASGMILHSIRDQENHSSTSYCSANLRLRLRNYAQNPPPIDFNERLILDVTIQSLNLHLEDSSTLQRCVAALNLFRAVLRGCTMRRSTVPIQQGCFASRIPVSSDDLEITWRG